MGREGSEAVWHHRDPGMSRAARGIPQDATRAPAVSIWAAIGCTAAIVYGSLLPFQTNGSAYSYSRLFEIAKRGFARPSAEDAWVNLLVYVPLGLLIVLVRPLSSRSGGSRVLVATVYAACVSLFCEALQSGLVSRVASLTDVAVNVAGAVLGALLGVWLTRLSWEAIRALGSWLHDRPIETLAAIVAFGLVLYGVAPFDFVTDTQGLHASFGRARWDLLGARAPEGGDLPFVVVIHQLSTASWFGLLGFLLGLGERQAGREAGAALGWAVKQGVVIACVIEFLQLFSTSHTVDVASLGLRVIAVVFGAWIAIYVIDGLSRSAWSRRMELAAPTPLWVMAALFQMTLLVLAVVGEGGWSPVRPSLLRKWCLPFEALRWQPVHWAAFNTASTLVVFGTLALTLKVIQRRVGLGNGNLLPVMMVLPTALFIELQRAAGLGRTADPTHVVLALAAVFVASFVLDLFRGLFLPVRQRM